MERRNSSEAKPRWVIGMGGLLFDIVVALPGFVLP